MQVYKTFNIQEVLELMKNKLIAGCVLGLTMLANVAFAEIDPGYVKRVLENDNGWPLATVCHATDVNLRTEPNTNCEVITMLQKGDIFYVKEVIEMPDYTWLRGVTASGDKGYMVSRYLNQAPRAAVTSERFRAAFATSTIYDINKFAQELGVNDQYDPAKVEVLKQERFHYAPHRIKVGDNWVHGEKQEDNFWTIGVIVTTPGYNIAGLEVGKKISVEEVATFSKNMNLIGWQDEGSYTDGYDTLYFYYYDTVDGSNRPVEGFAVSHDKNRIIREIRYWHIPVD